MLSKMRTMQKEHRERWILIILGLVFGIAGMTGSAFAAPPGSPYTPGETLDPSCAPGDTNCTVTSVDTTSAHTWTALQQFGNASTTLFSAYGPAYFGGSATSSFSSAGVLTLPGVLTV